MITNISPRAFSVIDTLEKEIIPRLNERQQQEVLCYLFAAMDHRLQANYEVQVPLIEMIVKAQLMINNTLHPAVIITKMQWFGELLKMITGLTEEEEKEVRDYMDQEIDLLIRRRNFKSAKDPR